MIQGLAAILLCLSWIQDEEIDNPEYKGWKEFKPGAWVKTSMIIETGGQKITMERTAKLIEVAAEKIVIEESTVTTIGEKKLEGPAKQRDVLPKKKKKDGEIKAEGDGEAEAGGKKLACHWYEVETSMGRDKEKKSMIKFWVNKEVPGGLVLMELKKPGEETYTKMGEALEWKTE